MVIEEDSLSTKIARVEERTESTKTSIKRVEEVMKEEYTTKVEFEAAIGPLQKLVYSTIVTIVAGVLLFFLSFSKLGGH